MMRWLLSNTGKRLSFAAKNPRYALRSLFRDLTLADERFLSSLVGVPARTIRSYLEEPIQTRELAACLRSAEAPLGEMVLQSADLYAKKVLVQYAAARSLRPDVIVETGVASGVSSTYLLFALHKNGAGILHSIELGDPRYLPAGKPPGWLVPEWLKSRWKLLIGDARRELPDLLNKLGQVDIFIHDSLHTYEQMLWEYRAAYPYLRGGGLLLSDDAALNAAFYEFAAEAGVSDAQILRGVGFLRKPR